ncbi:MAG: HK97 gp10 family phage protein [Pseudomonas sp.]
MGLIVKGLKGVMARISRSEKRVMDGSLSALRAMAELVATEARLNAPVDTGELENAISTIEDRTRNSKGQFGQVTIRVGVDTSKLKLEDHKGYDYSIPMHEGTYNLGPKSQAKQDAQGNIVGPKYLERALRDNEKKVKDSVAKAVEQGAKG